MGWLWDAGEASRESTNLCPHGQESFHSERGADVPRWLLDKTSDSLWQWRLYWMHRSVNVKERERERERVRDRQRQRQGQREWDFGGIGREDVPACFQIWADFSLGLHLAILRKSKKMGIHLWACAEVWWWKVSCLEFLRLPGSSRAQAIFVSLSPPKPLAIANNPIYSVYQTNTVTVAISLFLSNIEISLPKSSLEYIMISTE